jgi:hypothetical protein
VDQCTSNGSTPHELFEDAIKNEKEILKKYKAEFKKIVKTNNIRFASDVGFEEFSEGMQRFEFYTALTEPIAQTLLHEYY